MEISYTRRNYDTNEDVPATRKGTPEENIFYEHLESLPREPVPDEYGEAFKEKFPGGLKVDDDGFIGNLAYNYENNKWLRRQCKTKVVLRTKGSKEGEYSIIGMKYSPELKEKLYEKHDDIAEIINERFS